MNFNASLQHSAFPHLACIIKTFKWKDDVIQDDSERPVWTLKHHMMIISKWA